MNGVAMMLQIPLRHGRVSSIEARVVMVAPRCWRMPTLRIGGSSALGGADHSVALI